MRFCDFLTEGCVVPDLWGRDRDGVLQELAAPLAASTHTPVHRLVELLRERERLSSTAIGEGVAIPHCRVERLRRITACVAVKHEGVDFGARDGKPVRIFVTLVSPVQGAGTHLGVLARIATLMRDPHLRQAVLEAPSAAAILALFQRAEDAYLPYALVQPDAQP